VYGEERFKKSLFHLILSFKGDVMYKNNKFLAIIPARGGSKGIPHKNIYDINGRPLIFYTINEALKSKYLDGVIVSTDNDEIANVSKFYGAEVPFMRPAELATDTAKTISVIIHAVTELQKIGRIFDFVVILQPTQPLRKSDHIDEAIEHIINDNHDNLISVSEVRDHPLLIRSIRNEGFLKKLLNENSTVRRQDFEGYYRVNGAIYINKINKLLNEELSLNDNKWPYIMDQKYDLDIDCIEDIERFKYLLKVYPC
jgi:CMP-N,N'-diacetyllegionaminic acid synthase